MIRTTIYPNCPECKRELVNIEYLHSSYWTLICKNVQCTLHGKAQSHGRWDNVEVFTNEKDSS